MKMTYQKIAFIVDMDVYPFRSTRRETLWVCILKDWEQIAE